MNQFGLLFATRAAHSICPLWSWLSGSRAIRGSQWMVCSSAHLAKMSDSGLLPWYAATDERLAPRRQICVLTSVQRVLRSRRSLSVRDSGPACSQRPLLTLDSLSRAWNSTSSPAEIATCLGQVRVLLMSTMPSVGFRERCAIAVLNIFEGMSSTAVPVVSEPVPAVVGTGVS